MASYSRRLNRPRLFQLNPFRNYSNPGYVLVGNHKLVPEFQNTIELSYSQRSGKINFNGTLYGKFTMNSIIQTSLRQNDTLYFTYENAKRDKRLGSELSVNWSPSNWISCNLSGNLYDYKLDARDGSYQRRNTQFETSLNLTVNPINDLSIQSFSTLKSKNITIRGYVKGYFTTDLAVSKQFFEKKLRASLKVTDLFNGVDEHEFIENGDAQWQRYYKPDSRRVLLSLTLNLNRFSRKSTANPEATPY
jgi:outer membrane receptor protein involved in Fe transport